MNRYEGMFLFDNSTTHEWSAMDAEVRRLMERIGANLEVCVKYDERKLAYEIGGRKRGTFVLTYFDAPAEKITDLERDARLSDSILRLLVLRNSKVTAERIAELKAHPADQPLEPHSDSRRGDDRGDEPRRERRGDRYDRGDRGDRYDRGERGDRGDREGGGYRGDRSAGGRSTLADATDEMTGGDED